MATGFSNPTPPPLASLLIKPRVLFLKCSCLQIRTGARTDCLLLNWGILEFQRHMVFVHVPFVDPQRPWFDSKYAKARFLIEIPRRFLRYGYHQSNAAYPGYCFRRLDHLHQQRATDALPARRRRNEDAPDMSDMPPL